MSAEETAKRVRLAIRDLAAVGLRIECLSCNVQTAMEIENTMPAIAIVNGTLDLSRTPSRTICGIPLMVTP